MSPPKITLTRNAVTPPLVKPPETSSIARPTGETDLGVRIRDERLAQKLAIGARLADARRKDNAARRERERIAADAHTTHLARRRERYRERKAELATGTTPPRVPRSHPKRAALRELHAAQKYAALGVAFHYGPVIRFLQQAGASQRTMVAYFNQMVYPTPRYLVKPKPGRPRKTLEHPWHRGQMQRLIANVSILEDKMRHKVGWANAAADKAGARHTEQGDMDRRWHRKAIVQAASWLARIGPEPYDPTHTTSPVAPLPAAQSADAKRPHAGP